MKNIFERLAVLAFSIFLVSPVSSFCQKKPALTKFSLDDSKRVGMSAFTKLKGVELGSPVAIVSYDENHVLVVDRRAKAVLTLYDLRTGEKVDSLLRGRGPGECMNAFTVTVAQGKVYVDDLAWGGKVVVTSPKKGRVLALDHEVKIDGQYLRMIYSQPRGFIGTPLLEGRFEIIDDNGIPQETFGSFPKLKGDNSLVSNSNAQSRMAVSPDGRYLCSSYLGIDCIEIYSKNFRSLKRLWGPGSITPSVIVKGDGQVRMTVLDPARRVFSALSASNDTFIVGYVGDMTGRSFSSAGILHLLLFDWEGNLLRQIDLPEEVSSFDIDWQSGKVVAISKDDEPKILVAPIPIK
jgi:hypothetical protein